VLFVGLSLSAIAITGWEALETSSSALQAATKDRLDAVARAKARQLQRYFQDLNAHVLALSSDDSVLRAVEELGAAWEKVPPATAQEDALLRKHYELLGATSWWPTDARVRKQQHDAIAANPHPLGSKDRLLSWAGPYGKLHARYHPTLHRYQTAFGMYDIFLMDAKGRVIYSVFKEADFGVSLTEPPYWTAGLGRAFERAWALQDMEQAVIEDYASYLPSHNAPAAFIAAPIWRAGEKIGVLAMQVSSAEVDRIMLAEGDAYAVGEDNLLRSGGAGILTPFQESSNVLRSESRLEANALKWRVIAEMPRVAALAPVWGLRQKIFSIAALVAVVFWLVAESLAVRVTRPVGQLLAGAERLGRRDFSMRLAGGGNDELGQLAQSFNRMAESLEQTTVSKEELEVLAGRLITSQEDERRRLARDLHDHLSQRLAAAAIEAGRLRHALPEGDAQAALDRIKHYMADASAEVHGLSRRLHPAMLEDLGLLAAIEAEARAFFERGGPPVEIEATGNVERLQPELRLALYRLTQEALRNVEKHGRAESVRVRLRESTELVEWSIEDDGVGFDRQAPSWRPGLGLASMEERAKLLGGAMSIDSAPGKGTRIVVRFEYAQAEAAAGG
jgi:signal transduction histidine kinase